MIRLIGFLCVILVSCNVDYPNNEVYESNTQIERDLFDKGVKITRESYLGAEYELKEGDQNEVGFIVNGKKEGVIRFYVRKHLEKVHFYQNGKYVSSLKTKLFDLTKLNISGFGTIFLPKGWEKGFNESSFYVREKKPDGEYVPNIVYSVDKQEMDVSISYYYHLVLKKFNTIYEKFSVSTKYEFKHKGMKGIQIKYELREFGRNIIGLGTLLKNDNNEFVFINAAFCPKSKEEELEFINCAQLMVDAFEPNLK